MRAVVEEKILSAFAAGTLQSLGINARPIKREVADVAMHEQVTLASWNIRPQVSLHNHLRQVIENIAARTLEGIDIIYVDEFDQQLREVFDQVRGAHAELSVESVLHCPGEEPPEGMIWRDFMCHETHLKTQAARQRPRRLNRYLQLILCFRLGRDKR